MEEETMMKRLYASAIAACFVLPGFALADDLDGLTPQQLLPLAQKEGSVTVFSLSSRIAKVEAAGKNPNPGPLRPQVSEPNGPNTAENNPGVR